MITHASTAASSGRPRGRRPSAVPHFAHLALDALRAYRQELLAEERRVSYWRRILQARLDTARGRRTS